MRPSIKNHIFQQFFFLSLLTIVTLIGLVELMSDDLEENMVVLEAELEKAHHLPLTNNVVQTWDTATAQITFVPEGTASPDLPEVFQGLPIPFSGEIELPDKEYWVNISSSPTGVIYVAKDTSLFEQREELFLLGIIVVGILFIIISFILTQLSTRRIIKPLTELTQEISRINPLHQTMRVSEKYHDQELYSIATTFNTYLNTMEEYVKREQMLIGMASHELRTPIAVVSGALDILEERGSMSEKDKKTVERIRKATDEMNANVMATLMLARKQPASHPFTQILLSQSLQSVVQERLNTHPKDQARLSIVSGEIDHELLSDATLIHMLLKNLIQNALEHTQGNVTLQQNRQGLLITDEGTGLPQSVRLQLRQKTEYPNGYTNESGLGLFIVTLICERLDWRIEVDEKIEAGMGLQIYFPKMDSHAGQEK